MPILAPMLCRSADHLPLGAAWVYEPKFDGFRATVTRDGSDVSIRGRNGGRLARSFPEVVDAGNRRLPSDGRPKLERHPARARLRKTKT